MSTVPPSSNAVSASIYSGCLCFSLPWFFFFNPGWSKQSNQSLSTSLRYLQLHINSVCLPRRAAIFRQRGNTQAEPGLWWGGPDFIHVPATWANGWKENYSSACSRLFCLCILMSQNGTGSCDCSVSEWFIAQHLKLGGMSRFFNTIPIDLMKPWMAVCHQQRAHWS